MRHNSEKAEAYLIASNKTTLVLSDKRTLSSKISPLAFIALFFAVTVLPLVYIFTVIFPDAPWDQLFAKLPEMLGKIDWPRAVLNLAMIGVVFGQIVYLSWAKKRERLTLSPDGIRYTSPLPNMLKQFKPDWFLPWSQVTKAELGALNGRLISAAFVPLTLFTSSEKQRIFAALWVDSENYSRPVAQFKFTLTPMTPTQDEIIKSVMSCEVLQYISKNVPHLTVDSKLNKAEVPASLGRNPHGRIATGIVFLLIAYAFLDFILGPESYIDDPSSLLHIYISAGILGAILSGAWLYKSTLGNGEKIGLAMLIGVLVAVAMVPGALRINALTDSNAKNTYNYLVTLSSDGVLLRPVVDGLPTIDYFARNKFWGKFNRNDTYPVQIHKGILGFYQFNSSAIADDIHSHENN